jgi:uncharacterized protein YbgA (DUF1722 family)
MSSSAESPVRIGISACLLGEKVRFDGGHKRDRSMPADALGPEYRAGFMAALAVMATTGPHVNVLEHRLGYFREHLDGADTSRGARGRGRLRAGPRALIVPVTLIRHYVGCSTSSI